MGVNKQIIIGNLGEDPKVRTYQDGSKICRFTVAVTEKAYTMQNGIQVPEHTEWFNILVRGPKAGVAEQYLHKGDKVYIEGKTYTGDYQDQQGVTKRYTEVRCEVLDFLSSKPQTQPQQSYTPQQAPQYQQPAPQSMPQYAPAPQQPAPQQPQTQQVGVFGERPW